MRKQKYKPSLTIVRDCILLAGLFTFNSCNHQPQPGIQNDAVKKTQGSSIKTKEIFAAPSVHSITTANLPQIVKAGKPMTRIDTLKGGAPFFTNYGTDQGLAVSNIYCGLTDKIGNLWFGTNGGGVSRFDGKSFTNYTMAQGLVNNSVLAITQDKEGNLWFGTAAGLSKYDGIKFTNYTTNQGLVSNFIHDLRQDKAGNLWICTFGGVSKYDGKSFTNYTTDQGLASNIVMCIVEDNAGNLWFGTQGGGAIKYDGKSFTNYTTGQGLSNNNVFSITQDKAGNIWFGTSEGLSKYNGSSFTNYTTEQGLAGNNIYGIMQDRKGNIWLGTNGRGVSKYDGNGFTNYTTAQGLPSNTIRSSIQDRDGNVWFCTTGGGISKYDNGGLTNYTSGLGLSGYVVLCIMKDNAGNLWFGTEGEGISKYDGSRFTNYSSAQGLAGNNVWFIMQDRTGNIWFSTYAGVSKYDGNSFTTYTKAQGLAGNSVMSIVQDTAGNMWFSTLGEGVSKYDGSSFTNYTTSQGLPSNSIYSSMLDKAGNIWFGTIGGGVSKYDGRNFTNYTTSQGLPSNSIYSSMIDRNGNLWFGTDDGLSKYNGNSFRKYTTDSGLADNTIYAIAEDSIRNIIWFGTNLGLSGLKQYSSSNGNSESNLFEIFNNNTGYPIKDLNNNALCIDNKGILWAGCGDNKLIRFDYTAINKSTRPLNLEIQNVKVNNENICWNNLRHKSQTNKAADSLAMLNEMVATFGKVLSPLVLDNMHKKYGDIRFDGITRFYPVPVNLVLPYEDNNLTFEFAAIEPAMPKQVKYQYKMEGYDKDWSPLTNNTSAVFGRIMEGDYTFKLKALSPFGIWSEAEYTFKVLPPWQRTWWAYTIFALSFIGIIWGLLYSHSQKLRRENRILEETVAHRTNQLEKSLEELKSTQAQLIQSEKMASLGELTAGIAHEIQNPLNFVNNFSEVNRELIEELKEEAKSGHNNEVIAIADNISANEEKIIHHGKRADAIVKGMMQHTQTSSGQKELTDINALADKYLRLSYHGFHAKDTSFDATIHNDFDESIGKVNIIPQDIGRVLLNLYNNAFYAVNEKKKQQPDGYEPSVSVSTKKKGDKVLLTVKDNGNGIPQNVIDKIFQPFFTTKPTGEGTGLGLSLSYDIITKEHRGTIKANTREGEFAEFIIQLPISDLTGLGSVGHLYHARNRIG